MFAHPRPGACLGQGSSRATATLCLRRCTSQDPWTPSIAHESDERQVGHLFNWHYAAPEMVIEPSVSRFRGGEERLQNAEVHVDLLDVHVIDLVRLRGRNQHSHRLRRFNALDAPGRELDSDGRAGDRARVLDAEGNVEHGRDTEQVGRAATEGSSRSPTISLSRGDAPAQGVSMYSRPCSSGRNRAASQANLIVSSSWR